MNHLYRSIWNAALGSWVAAPETARSASAKSSGAAVQGSGTRSSRESLGRARLGPLALAIAVLTGGSALALGLAPGAAWAQNYGATGGAGWGDLDGGAAGATGKGEGGGAAGTVASPDGRNASIVVGVGGGGGGYSQTANGDISTDHQGGNGGRGSGGGGGGDGVRITPTVTSISIYKAVTGGNGGNGNGGGGGGGGGGVVFRGDDALTTNQKVSGGNGGSGSGSGSGSGGGGGAGVVMQGAGQLTANAGIVGGKGGEGSTSYSSGNAGAGVLLVGKGSVTSTVTGSITGGSATGVGRGGDGVLLLTGGTIDNAGAIRGGNGGGMNSGGVAGYAGGTGSGGAAGFVPYAGSGSAPGGAGITGAGITITNSGSIAGGTAKGVQADAIAFTGGSNHLALKTGSKLTGVINIFRGATARIVARDDGLVMDNAIVLGGDGTVDSNGNAFEVSGVISGAGSLAKTGAGTLSLSVANTYSGTTTIQDGTLRANMDFALSSNSAFTLADTSGVTLDFGDTKVQYIGSLAGGGTTGGQVILGDGMLFAGGNNSSTTYGGKISGLKGDLIKEGSGTLTLTGDSHYGITYLTEGNLVVKDGGKVQNSHGFIEAGSVTVSGTDSVWNNAILLDVGDVSGVSGTLTVADDGKVSVNNGSGRIDVATNAGAVGVVNIGAAAGAAAQAAGTLEAGELRFGAGNGSLNFNHTDTAYAFDTQITGTGQLNQLAGTTLLSGANTYSGTTTIQGGTLRANGSGAFSGNSAFTLADTAGAILDLGGTSQDIGSLAGGGTTGGEVTLDGRILTAGWDNRSTTYGGKISGAGNLIKQGSGTLTLTGDSNYGLTGVKSGNLVVKGGGKVQNYEGRIADGGSVTVTGKGSAWNNRALYVGDGHSGHGTLTVADGGKVSVDNGSGRIDVAGSPGSTGVLNIGAAAGADAQAAGTLGALELRFGDGNGSLNFNHTDTAYAFGTQITGAGQLNQLAGTTLLSGANTYTGTTAISGGKLVVEGSIGGTGAVTVASGGTLAGKGLVAGAVTVAAGGALDLAQGQTLTTGALTLDPGAQINAALGIPSGTTLMRVGGDLVLNGTVNVSDAGGLSVGVYRLMEYSGQLSGKGLAMGLSPTENIFAVQTSVGQQVNLVNTGGHGLQFWDGSDASQFNDGQIDGGNGTWTVSGSEWTGQDGLVNAPATPQPGFAIFQGTAGTVTVDHSAGAVAVTGMQFATDGYVLQGDAVALSGAEAIIKVGDMAGATTRATIASELSGAARLHKMGDGTLILAGANSYTGGTLVSAGTLQGDTISLRGAIENNAKLVFAQTTDGSHADAMSGRGSLSKTEAGTLTLTGDARHTGGTLIEEGMLRVGNGGTIGSLAGDVVNNATLAFERSDAVDFGGAISGTGAVVQEGSGTLTLANVNRYSGGTEIRQGTLAGNAASFGSGGIDIAPSGLLAVRQDSDADFANSLSGSGAFTKGGSAVLNLTGDSGAFRGKTDVQSGTLAVNGTLGGSLAVHDGATLTGNGTVGSTTVLAGGTVAPGSMGTLNVAGELRFAPGSVYQVEADPHSNASSQIFVDSTATLGGSVVHVGPEGGFEFAKTYTILRALGGVHGQFDTVASHYAYLDPKLEYAANSVQLQLARKSSSGGEGSNGSGNGNGNGILSFADLASTPNQVTVATNIEGQGLGALYDHVLHLPAGSPGGVFEQLSGDSHANVQGSLPAQAAIAPRVSLQYLRRNMRAGQRPGAAMAQSGGPLPAAAWPSSKALPVWAEVVGRWQTQNGDGNAARTRQHTGGLLVGGDGEVGNGWRLGGALGYTRADGKVADRSAIFTTDSYSATVYGGKSFAQGAGHLNVQGGLAYTWHDIATERQVGSLDQTLKADYRAHTAQLFGEVGYALGQYGPVGVEPFAGITVGELRTGAFQERGGFAALQGQNNSENQTSSTLGVRAHSDFKLSGSEGRLRASLGWRHAFGDLQQRKAMAFAGAQNFTVAGAPLARNTAVLGLDAELELSRSASLVLDYRGEWGSGSREHAASVAVRWAF